MRRLGIALAMAGALAATMSTSGAAAQRTPTLPPVCVKHALPDGLQLQVGYCPNARRR